VSNKTIEIRFGGEQVEFLLITVRGRAYRQSQDYWDGNWLLVTAAVRAGKFTGEIPGMLRAEELQQFSDDLRSFRQSLTGSVVFDTMEGWLNLRIEPSKTGRIAIEGEIQDDVSAPFNNLEFNLEMDQTFLLTPLQQLEQVVKAFPVVGKP
jgi:hypothetical protein